MNTGISSTFPSQNMDAYSCILKFGTFGYFCFTAFTQSAVRTDGSNQMHINDNGLHGWAFPATWNTEAG
jgi:hypothetical protein